MEGETDDNVRQIAKVTGSHDEPATEQKDGHPELQ